jgi:hypothetical protein
MSLGAAAMTRTRVDSAAKHILACKVDTNLMKTFSGIPNADLQVMHHKRLELMTCKDDLILNVSRKVACVDTRTFHAYPAVVSTLGKCTRAYQLILAVMYSSAKASDFERMIKAVQHTDKVSKVHDFIANLRQSPGSAASAFMDAFPDEDKLKEVSALSAELRTMPFYQLQGYSLGQAWASPISGDTVFSVLIGGCVTAMNGHFAMQAGQLVQWYFDFEHPFFANVHGENCMVGQRLGAHRQVAQAIGQKRRKLEEPLRGNFVHPKPYVPDFVGEVYADRIRVFGKCLNGAGPFEPVDIMIMTQSL